jgi:DNA-binding MarR family transcriptional regulator
VEQNLGFNLRALTARLERAADRILRAEHNVTYSRVLALTLVGELGASTQRDLADRLGVTEPSVSQMVGVLAGEGLLDVRPDPGGGRRKRLSLTTEGKRLVGAVQRVLEGRMVALLESSGVPYDEYAEHTARLVATLGRAEQEAVR